MIEYLVCNIYNHENGLKHHGWSDSDHEKEMLKEKGEAGWILSTISGNKYYFYKKIYN